jgi:Stage II sporulation protein E (SpoIIE)
MQKDTIASSPTGPTPRPPITFGTDLLPVEWSRLNGVDLNARYHSECRGGDFFDALAISQRVLFLLTDIAGMRSQAKQVALVAQTVFRQRAQELFEDSEVNESNAVAALAHAVNLALIEAADGVRFAPTFLGCFNQMLGILTYCNAGSLLALLRDGGNVRVLESPWDSSPTLRLKRWFWPCRKATACSWSPKGSSKAGAARTSLARNV